MHAMALLLALTSGSCVGLTEKEWIELLDRDFRELVQKEADPQPMLEAAVRLRPTEGQWTIRNMGFWLRKSRCPAAVPLLLKSMLETKSRPRLLLDDAKSTLLVLTGEEISPAKTPLELVETWYKPLRGKIVTDFKKLSPEQLRRIVLELRTRGENNYIAGVAGEEGLDQIRPWVDLIVDGDPTANDPGWVDHDLHRAMIPLIEKLAGADPAQKEKPSLIESIRWAKFLGRFRRRGELPELSKQVDDERTPINYRWAALVALHYAGEDASAKRIVELMRKDGSVQVRVIALAMLAKIDSVAAAEATLVDALGDPEPAVRNAAIDTLVTHPLPAAAPGLVKLLDEKDQSYTNLFPVLGSIATPQVKEALAKYLAGKLKPGVTYYELSGPLEAFQSAVGRRWTDDNTRTDEQMAQKTAEALAWWNDPSRKK